ncbi:hypothetical protein VTJ04DRAFT_3630 [Mycothermus thermophilus]|uniref:uncharacterized protein n=1 Tax=Humicola insolens TaxID=85995 RepID=UPI003742BD6E
MDNSSLKEVPTPHRCPGQPARLGSLQPHSSRKSRSPVLSHWRRNSGSLPGDSTSGPDPHCSEETQLLGT